jgi:hypothetical protein
MFRMTKLLEEAIDRLRKLPSSVQDSAARAMLFQLEEEAEPGDREATAVGRNGFENCDFTIRDRSTAA